MYNRRIRREEIGRERGLGDCGMENSRTRQTKSGHACVGVLTSAACVGNGRFTSLQPPHRHFYSSAAFDICISPPPNATTTLLGYKRIQRVHRASAKALW